jgi:hypothetical protein
MDAPGAAQRGRQGVQQHGARRRRGHAAVRAGFVDLGGVRSWSAENNKATMLALNILPPLNKLMQSKTDPPQK